MFVQWVGLRGLTYGCLLDALIGIVAGYLVGLGLLRVCVILCTLIYAVSIGGFGCLFMLFVGDLLVCLCLWLGLLAILIVGLGVGVVMFVGD